MLEALHGRDDVIQSLLTGNIEANAVVKVSAFGLERWLDFEVGAYGSDPHEERSDLVAVARDGRRRSTREPTGAVLVGDTPLDVRAAHEAGARAVAVATGFAGRGDAARVGAGRLPGGLRGHRRAAVAAISLPLDAAADGIGLRPLGLLAAQHRVERLAQPGRVLGRIAVVGVRRAAVAQPPSASRTNTSGVVFAPYSRATSWLSSRRYGMRPAAVAPRRAPSSPRSESAG